MEKVLGIDIGGSSIKAGLVSFDGGVSVESFQSIDVGHQTTPEVYAAEMVKLENSISGSFSVGIGFPSVVRDNCVAGMPDNMHLDWRGANLCDILFPERAGVFAVNDADAAGLAEVLRPEAGALRKGTTVVLTLGTGIGSAIFIDGQLLPNSELGLIEMNGDYAERYAAPSIKTKDNLSMEEWALRLDEYISRVEHYLSADTIVLGGGISNRFEEFGAKLERRARVVPAYYRQKAGVIGAAVYGNT